MIVFLCLLEYMVRIVTTIPPKSLHASSGGYVPECIDVGQTTSKLKFRGQRKSVGECGKNKFVVYFYTNDTEATDLYASMGQTHTFARWRD